MNNRGTIGMWGSRIMLVAAMALIGAGCDTASEDAPKAVSASAKPRVVATTTLIGDLAKQIAGDKVDLITIMGAGVDPHSYKPSTADLGNLSRANLVLYNGLHLEGKMVELLEHKLSERAVAITGDIPQDLLLPWKEGQGGAHDPHIWFDATLWARAAQTVGAALAKVDAPNASQYEQRAKQIGEQMQALHDYAKQRIATIPAGRAVLITSHDAYNYFGRAYGVEVFGLQGISTETEAGLANINSAVDFIIRRKIPAIFVESSVSPKTIERVQADCKSRGFDVKIGGELYSDAMGVAGEHEGYAVETYDGMFRYNVDTIVNALSEGQGGGPT